MTCKQAARRLRGRLGSARGDVPPPDLHAEPAETAESAFDPAAYWQERLSNNLSLVGVGHGGVGAAYNRWLYRVRRDVFLRNVRAAVGQLRSLSVLDIGSGTGFYLQRWGELGVRRIAGADLTDVAVTALREVYGEDRILKLDVGAVLDEPVAGPFDAISMIDVLFHIVDDERYERAFRNVYSLLKPGGLFVFSDTFASGERRVGRHVIYRTSEEIERALRDAGFEVLGRRPMFSLMLEPTDSRSPGRRFLWRVIARVAPLDERLGHLLGMVLYPIEVMSVRLLHRGPSLELMLARRPTDLGSAPTQP